jgi:hypothetical protein
MIYLDLRQWLCADVNQCPLYPKADIPRRDWYVR